MGASEESHGFSRSVTAIACAAVTRAALADAGGSVEVFGGLGDTWSLSTGDTSHYVAPIVGWQLPPGRLSFSTGFGLTGSSLDRVYRIGWASEIPQFGGLFRRHDGAVR